MERIHLPPEMEPTTTTTTTTTNYNLLQKTNVCRIFKQVQMSPGSFTKWRVILIQPKWLISFPMHCIIRSYAASAKPEKAIISYRRASASQSSEMLLDKHFQVISENFINSPTPNLKSCFKQGIPISWRDL